MKDDRDERIQKALEVAYDYAGIDGDHHKAWVIDQMVRALAGHDYDRWVTYYRDGEEGPETFTWNCGTAP